MEKSQILSCLFEIKSKVLSIIDGVASNPGAEFSERSRDFLLQCKRELELFQSENNDTLSTSCSNQSSQSTDSSSKEEVNHSPNSDSGSQNTDTPADSHDCDVIEDDDFFSNFDFDEFMETSRSAPEIAPNQSVDVEEDEFDDDMLLADESSFQQETDDTVQTDNLDQPADISYRKVLKNSFGYDKFRPLQWTIIKSVMKEKRDNFVVMSTGYGKSLTFQFPSVYTGRCSIIVSPLISLMEDQVLALQASCIEACLLGSAQSNISEVKREMFAGKYRLIYITPESVVNLTDELKHLNAKVGIDLFAIDEAHCVSQWGNDFRPAYRNLSTLKRQFPSIPFLAVTATATKQVQEDIMKNLQLRNPLVTLTSFDRPNLYLSVVKKSTNAAIDLKRLMKRNGTKFEFDGPTIIYCQTVKMTHELKSVLDDMKVPSGLYHARLTLKQRKECHKDFLNDRLQVVVATVAFGMGIDKPDVRNVIHYGAPKEVETYYQEIGRAGRDGMRSNCTVVYAEPDFNTIKHLLNQGDDRFKEHKFRMFQTMKKYLTTRDCRRRVLLHHFEPDKTDDLGGFENCCDCCKARSLGNSGANETDVHQPDYSKEAALLLKAIEVTGNIYGLATPIKVLLGSCAEKVKRFKDTVVHGEGKYKQEKFWKALGQCLMNEEFLVERPIPNGFGSSVEMTRKAREWMAKYRGNAESTELHMTPSFDLLNADTTRRNPMLTPLADAVYAQDQLPSVDPVAASQEKELYLKLLQVRDDIFKETGYAPHSIASNKILLEMAKIRPSTLQKMLQLEDFSQVKIGRFGQKFLDVINPFCQQNAIDGDHFSPTNENQDMNEDKEVMNKMSTLNQSQQMSYQLFMMSKKCLESVASSCGLKTSTIITHLCNAIEAGLYVDKTRLGVSEYFEKIISRTIFNSLHGDVSSLTDIKKRLPLSVEYNHIKLVISELKQKCGEETNSEGVTVLSQPDDFVMQSQVSSTEVLASADKKRLSPSEDWIESSPPTKVSKIVMLPSPSKVATSASVLFQDDTALASPTTQTISLQSSQGTGSKFENGKPVLQRASSQGPGSRSIPAWMPAAGNKNVFKKKIRSNSLFK